MSNEELIEQLMFQLKRVEELEAELTKKERHIETYKRTNQELGDMLRHQHGVINDQAEELAKLRQEIKRLKANPM